MSEGEKVVRKYSAKYKRHLLAKPSSKDHALRADDEYTEEEIDRIRAAALECKVAIKQKNPAGEAYFAGVLVAACGYERAKKLLGTDKGVIEELQNANRAETTSVG